VPDGAPPEERSTDPLDALDSPDPEAIVIPPLDPVSLAPLTNNISPPLESTLCPAAIEIVAPLPAAELPAAISISPADALFDAPVFKINEPDASLLVPV
jgi:hypothetical protein